MMTKLSGFWYFEYYYIKRVNAILWLNEPHW